jgi:hypothetical protein
MANTKRPDEFHFTYFWDMNKDVLIPLGITLFSAAVAVGLALLIPPLGFGLLGSYLIVLGIGATIGIGLLGIACCFFIGGNKTKKSNTPVEQPQGAESRLDINPHSDTTNYTGPTSASGLRQRKKSDELGHETSTSAPSLAMRSNPKLKPS